MYTWGTSFSVEVIHYKKNMAASPSFQAMSLMQYLQIELQPPLAPILPTDIRSAFYSVGEVEIMGICPRITDPPLLCYGECL